MCLHVLLKCFGIYFLFLFVVVAVACSERVGGRPFLLCRGVGGVWEGVGAALVSGDEAGTVVFVTVAGFCEAVMTIFVGGDEALCAAEVQVSRSAVCAGVPVF